MADEGLEIIAVAQDTGGEAAAGKYYDKAQVGFTSLLDPSHRVTALYGMCNVPTGVWIDEEGRIVRTPEVAYSKGQRFGTLEMGTDLYSSALRDWVKRGSKSAYVMARKDLLAKLSPKNPKRALADAHFNMAVHLQTSNRLSEAATHWHAAQNLAPDNWNYHRQEWVFEPATQSAKWQAKFQKLGGRPYYEPADLSEAKQR